jgi:predicted HicB family RNase H-like nuclease
MDKKKDQFNLTGYYPQLRHRMNVAAAQRDISTTKLIIDILEKWLEEDAK